MKQSRTLARVSLALAGVLLSGTLMFGWTGASAQEMDDQEITPPRSDISEATPLITVRPGPAVPERGGPPPAAGPMPELPAMYSQPVGPFTMIVDVIATGPSSYGLFTSPGCILDGVFKRGMKLVWRFEVYDMATGVRVNDREGAQVMMNLPDGTSIPARFDQRGGGPSGGPPPDAPWTWVATWNIPTDYPLGPVDYSVTVTTPDGRTGTIQPSSMGSRYPQVIA